MQLYIVTLLLACILSASAWSMPFYPVPRRRAPMRYTRFAPPPPQPHRMPGPASHRLQEPIRVAEPDDDDNHRPKRNHHDDDHDEYDHNHNDHRDHHEYGDKGVTGPVHTFVKTDKNANYKWGVRHHVGGKYAS